MNNSNKGILIVIAVVLVAILGVMVMKGGGFLDRRSPIEKAADSVGEAAEEIGDEIDDHTTAK